MSLQAILPRMTPDSLIMGQYPRIALAFSMMQGQQSWRFVDTYFLHMVAKLSQALLSQKVAGRTIMGSCHCAALVFSKV